MALRFQSNYDLTDVPIPTTRHPPANPASTTIRRAKTLTRPERGVAPVPLINPQVPSPPGASPKPSPDDYNGSHLWRYFSLAVTFWAPDFLLASLAGLKDKAVRQAWREKITLCFIILWLCAAVGFATVGFQKVLCPINASSSSRFLHVGSAYGVLAVQGVMFNATSATSTVPDVDFPTLLSNPGQDITSFFQRSASDFKACTGLEFHVAQDQPCANASCPLPPFNLQSTYAGLNLINTGFLAGYSWDQVTALNNYFVLDGAVLNMKPYLKLHPSAIPTDPVDTALRTLLKKSASVGGKDGTRLFSGRSDLYSAIPCLKQRYHAGNIDKITAGCFVSNLVLYVGLVVILGLVFVRFVMACVFNWFLSHKLAGPPNTHELNRTAISPSVMPGGANVSVDNMNGTAPWAGPVGARKNTIGKQLTPNASSSSTTLIAPDNSVPIMSLNRVGAELFAVCLVTCYSEGEDSLRTTLDSISTTTYSDARKLLFVVADGMITGAGEKRSTPDICVSLLQADPRFGNPIPMSYGAVGSGSKAQNRALVYAGHYSKNPSTKVIAL